MWGWKSTIVKPCSISNYRKISRHMKHIFLIDVMHINCWVLTSISKRLSEPSTNFKANSVHSNKKPVHIVSPTLYCSLKFCSKMWRLPSPDWCLTPTFGAKHSSIPSPFCEIGEVIVNFDSCHVDFIHYVLIITDNDLKNKLKDAQNWRYKIGNHQ